MKRILAIFLAAALLIGMRRIPVSLIESAKLDGASEWHVFWDICLPQCRSALYSIAILVFIDNWNMRPVRSYRRSHRRTACAR